MRSIEIGIAAVMLVWGGWAWGAPPAARPVNAATIKGVFEEQAQVVEKELGQRMLRRPDLTGDKLAELELGIDLRFLERWMLSQGAGAAMGSEMQVGWRLRSAILRDSTQAIETVIDGADGKLTPAQAGAAGHIHQLTFNLPEVKGGKEQDALAHRLGLEISVLLGTQGQLPAMRPTPLALPLVGVRPGAEPARSATAAQQVSRLSVSGGLRQQLLALVNAATPKPGGEKDPAMSAMLESCIDLAQGLQYNTAVSPEARVAMEGQLAEGVALYLDPRTREVGKAHIGAMGQYRQLLSRVGKLNLPAEQIAQFAPVLNFVRDNPEVGGKVLGAIEKYAASKASFEGRAKSPNPMLPLQRAQSDLERQFGVGLTTFVTTALDLPKGLGTSAADVENKAQDLARIVDTLDRLDRMQGDIAVLNAFKPRPGGQLEKKVAVAGLAAANAAASPNRAEAIRFLLDVDRLAQDATELGKLNTADIPSYLEKRWTGGKLGAMQTHWKSVVTEQASLLATGAAMDQKKVDRLMVAVTLVDALRNATAMDANLAEDAPLERWVDWRLSVDDLKPLLRPYPDAVADAFSAYVADSAAGLDLWAQNHQRYQGLVAMINRDSAYRQQCSSLPTGNAASAAQMLTPIEGQPFGVERYVGFCAWLYRNRPEMGEEVFGMMNKRVGE
jgi:hypothetical protein